MASKCILLGLDGATYDLLDPWMEEGILPHLKSLLSRGAKGVLRSTDPPTTPPAWTSVLTGVNPGKHGIFDFRDSYHRDPRRPLVSSRSMRAPRIWQILNAAGLRAAIMNVPITFPPEPLDGFMISGMMTPNDEADYTYPAELKSRLNDMVGHYVVDVDIPRYDVEIWSDAVVFFDDVERAFTRRSQAFLRLLEEEQWDFFMVVFVVLDRIQHLFWKYMVPEFDHYHTELGARVRERVRAIYTKVDETIGAVMDRLDSSTTLLLCSDHGFGGTKAWFNVNRWLEREGFLTLVPSVRWKKRLFYTLMSWNDSPLVKALVPKSLQSMVRGHIRAGRSTFKTDVLATVNWARTTAFFASIPSQGIYINRELVPEGKREALRTRIRQRLLALEDPSTGRPFIDRVMFPEEIYQGPETAYAPDILFVAQDYGYLGRQLFGTSAVIETSLHTPNGFHRISGIFGAYGPHIVAGTAVDGAEIHDITATVLYSMGEPIPPYMDGKVLSDIFTPEHRHAHPIRRGSNAQYETGDRAHEYSDNEQQELEERLRSLGYLG
ncbi:alkaline phosphatase family protein [Candidatus Fermentibacteria bacterium]|nr:alkaline phosphatase family protein [Candidatus Fermentibacteria bacterium]